MIKKIFLTSLLTVYTVCAFSQNEKEKEDETKMVREVISVQMDKPKSASGVDTGSTVLSASASELSKRAQNWSGSKSVKYTKSNCTNNGNGVACQATFPYKIKELNPTDKVEGEITMTVTIEAKEGKYRYTINNIKHKASVANASGGDIYATVPECGSMSLTDLSWKHIKAAALIDAKLIADELKAKMAQPSGEAPKKDDW